MEEVRSELEKVGFQGDFHIGLMNPRHILIRFERKEDFQRCWIQTMWNIKGYAMRILKWQPGSRFEEDPPVVPIWIALHELPIEFLNPQILFSVAVAIGKPLQVDTPTLNLTRPSVARFYVEVDLTKQKEFPAAIKIGKKGKKYEQAFTYEFIPAYCDHCQKIGHNDTVCKQKIGWSLEHEGKKFADARQLIEKKKAKKVQPVSKSQPRVSANPSPQSMHVPPEKLSSSGLTQKEKDTIVVDIESSPPKQKDTGIKKNTECSSDDQPRNSLNLVVSTSANKFAVLDTIQEEEGEIVEDVTVEDGLEDSEPTDNSENRHNDTSLPPEQEGSTDLGPELSTLEAFQKELSALGNDTVLPASDFADDGVIGKNSEIGETIIVEQESWSEGDLDVYEDQERVTAQGSVSLPQKRGRKTKAELTELNAGVALRRSPRLH
ncbi:OLC1v1018699C1 [Oldenlandia corymbosa var. corymbosa]|uniref:OLC1v1018699C1 n=1 Tax=Oldenlandia corymbosa var. corymbosa TaxID=529605 RepID=A0AAV1EC77_OLDCO|nr:OLC1v1018699C1 [Oldenlandia corymbosa var. corymbosa]